MDERSERIERHFDIPVLVAALLVIPVIVIEESSFGEPWNTLADVLNWGTWLVFLAEVVVMLSVAPDRGRWARRHPIEVAVVILTPPFIAALAGVRLLRLLRLLPLLKLGPLMRTLFSIQGLQYTAMLAALTAVAGGAGFAALEEGDKSTADGIYWAVTTMTTVGYGDVLPTTTETKALALIVMLVGIGFVAVLTGAIAQRFLIPELEAEEAAVESDIEDTSAAVLRELRAIGTSMSALDTRLTTIEAAVTRKRLE